MRGFWSRASTGLSPAPPSRRPMRAGGTRSPEPPPTSGAAHRRQGLHPSPVEGRLRGRGIGLQTPLRKNMADGRHPGFARMPVKVRRMAKTVIAQPAQHFSLRAHTGAGPLAPHQLGRAKNARPYCGRLPQPVCRTAATPVRGTALTMKSAHDVDIFLLQLRKPFRESTEPLTRLSGREASSLSHRCE